MGKINILKRTAAIAILSGLAISASAQTIGLYGDPTFDRVVAVDVEGMVQLGEVYTQSTPYPVDRAGTLDKVYAITRGAPSVDIVDPNDLSNLGTIPLDHNPRSGEAFNERFDLVLIAGANKPMSSLIDPNTDEVVATAGVDELTIPQGYGGSLSSGHPVWFSNRTFAIIDRANRKIQMYRLRGNHNKGFTTKLLDEIETPSSVHHIISAGKGRYKTFYAVLEGAPDEGLRPGLMELSVNNKHLVNDRTVYLEGYSAELMGSHHADLHPNDVDIYVGSAEGHMFVINRSSMQVEKVIESGQGSAHTRFIPEREIAIITNHQDTFVTIVDTNSNEKLQDVTVSPAQQNGQILQSHTNHVNEDADAYYAFASDSGTFFELDLDALAVSRTVFTDGTPRQGVFINASAE